MRGKDASRTQPAPDSCPLIAKKSFELPSLESNVYILPAERVDVQKHLAKARGRRGGRRSTDVGGRGVARGGPTGL